MAGRKPPPPDQENNIQLALRDLKRNPGMKISKAARKYAVSYKALWDRKVLGRQNYREAHATEQRLTPIQEAYLVKYLK